MKSNWEIKKLSDVCTIVNGGTPDTAVKRYWGDPLLWITPKDMGKSEQIFVDDTARKITMEGLKNSSAKLLPVNSVILSSRAPIGHLAINTKEIATNQGCKGLVPHKELDTFYLYYFLKNSVGLLNELGSGTTFKELSGTKLSTVEIPLPDRAEQLRIVTKVGEIFENADKEKRIAEINLENIKELYRNYSQTVFEHTGDNWETKRLKEVCEKITDGTHQTPSYYENGYIFLSSRNVTSGKVNWDNVKYIDEKQHTEMHKRVSPRIGDILLAKNGTTGVGALVDRDVSFDIYVSLALLRVTNDITPEYLLYFVNSPFAKKQFNKRLKGSGVPNLHLQEIKEVVISFPKSKQEQNTTVLRLKGFLEQKQSLERIYQQKIQHLEELKKSVLNKAFIGEL
ncbi:MAG: restriction endonuclease subunit S [Patescibacteria group bacterium]